MSYGWLQGNPHQWAGGMTGGGTFVPDHIIAPSNDVRTPLQAALDAVAIAGGGSILLQAGTHVFPDTSAIVWNGSNLTLYGEGPSTVIENHLADNQWVFEIIGGTVQPIACGNTTQGQTQITMTSHIEAASRTAGMPIMILGTDANGMRHCEANFAAANGDGDTGIILLTSPLTYTLTSVSMRSYTAMNNTLRDFKIVHNSEVTTHSFGILYGYRTSLIRIEGDGGGAVTGSMNFASIGGNLYPKMIDCIGYDYNTVEHYLGTDGCKGVEWPDDNYGGEFTGNNFDNCGSTELPTADMWVLGAVQENCVWENNTLTNSEGITQHLIEIGSTAYLTNCRIDGNMIVESKEQAIYGRSGANYMNTTINGNTIDTVLGATFFPGIQIITPSYNTGMEISGNHVNDVSCEAIAPWGLRDAQIRNNTIVNCSSGIYPYAADGIEITGNTCNGLGVGIYLYQTDNALIDGNFCNSCTGYGLRSDGGCNGVEITGNEFKNGVNGMRFLGADDDVTIDGNTATGNSTANLFIGDTNSNFNITNNDLRTGTVTLGSGTNIVFGAGNLVD